MKPLGGQDCEASTKPTTLSNRDTTAQLVDQQDCHSRSSKNGRVQRSRAAETRPRWLQRCITSFVDQASMAAGDRRALTTDGVTTKLDVNWTVSHLHSW